MSLHQYSAHANLSKDISKFYFILKKKIKLLLEKEFSLMILFLIKKYHEILKIYVIYPSSFLYFQDMKNLTILWLENIC